MNRQLTSPLLSLTICLLSAFNLHAANVERKDVVTLPAGYVKDSIDFSEDAQHYVYLVESGGTRQIVYDGRTVQSPQGLGSPFLSPSGKVFSWVVSEGLAHVLADGVLTRTTIAGNNAVRFSDAGDHWAALGGERFVRGGPSSPMPAVVMYLDGALVGRYSDFTAPAFSPDGKHMAFAALDSSDQMTLIVDEGSGMSFLRHARSIGPMYGKQNRGAPKRPCSSSAMSRTGYPSAGCSPAEPASVSPGASIML